MEDPKLILDPRPVVEAALGIKHSQLYRDISNDGLMTKPVKLGRSSRWPRHEHQAIAAARIAGQSDDEIRILVQSLHAARGAANQAPAKKARAAK